jgi:anti-sigma regulatory factor (Ser/Thr protein kinase)
MIQHGHEQTVEQLVLRSQLSEIAKITGWIERIASRFSIPSRVRFAMNLCLEEALSNIIRHGYRSEENRPIVLHLMNPEPGYLVFVVEDEALGFNLLEQPELPPMNPWNGRLGGQGIRLIRRFADTLDYDPMPNGNRLRIGFFVDSAGGA